MRYYQSMIDLNILNKGTDYKKLNKSFIIFKQLRPSIRKHIASIMFCIIYTHLLKVKTFF